LLCLACASQALTLGRIRGAALLGKPLDMVVPIQLDAGEDVASLCFDAEVFHADARQDASRVRVLVEAAEQAQLANLRILSSALIDEPVVTVYLHTGCAQKTTRRYVLLPDLPSAVDVPSTPLEVSLPVSQPALAPTGLTAALPAAQDLSAPTVSVAPPPPVPTARARSTSKSRQSVRPGSANRRTKAKAARVSSTGAPANEKKEVGQVKGQSRLKLDSLELLFSDRIANLESSPPVKLSDDALRSSQKVQTQETELKALRALTAQNQTSLLDLKMRLQEAEADRFPSTLVYGLAALLLASVAAMAFLWNRQRQAPASGANWSSSAVGQLAAALPESESEFGPKSQFGPKSESEFEFESEFEPEAAPVAVTSPEPKPTRTAKTLTESDVAKPTPVYAPAAVEETVVEPQEAKPVTELDLNLSDLFIKGAAPKSAPATEPALLPSLPAEPPAGNQSADATAPPGDSNLIDFDLLETPKPPRLNPNNRAS